MNTIRDRRLFTTLPAVTTPYPTVYAGIAGDTTVVIPTGYLLEYMTFLNSTANTAILSCGTVASAGDVFTNMSVNSNLVDNGLTTFSTGLIKSLTTPTTLYIHDDIAGDTWNGASVTIYLVLRRIA